jgi:hypothetical protein
MPEICCPRSTTRRAASLIRKSDWDEIDFPPTGFVTRRFFPPEERSVIDSAILVLEPGTSIPVRKNIKNGQEVLCVLRGEVQEHGDTTLQLFASAVNLTNTTASSFVLWVSNGKCTSSQRQSPTILFQAKDSRLRPRLRQRQIHGCTTIF